MLIFLTGGPSSNTRPAQFIPDHGGNIVFFLLAKTFKVGVSNYC